MGYINFKSETDRDLLYTVYKHGCHAVAREAARPDAVKEERLYVCGLPYHYKASRIADIEKAFDFGVMFSRQGGELMTREGWDNMTYLIYPGKNKGVNK